MLGYFSVFRSRGRIAFLRILVEERIRFRRELRSMTEEKYTLQQFQIFQQFQHFQMIQQFKLLKCHLLNNLHNNFNNFRLPWCHIFFSTTTWPSQVTPQLVLHRLLHARVLQIHHLQIIWLKTNVYSHLLILVFFHPLVTLIDDSIFSVQDIGDVNATSSSSIICALCSEVFC